MVFEQDLIIPPKSPLLIIQINDIPYNIRVKVKLNQSIIVPYFTKQNLSLKIML